MHPVKNSNTPKSISLILPAWNECEVIVRAIEEADSALRLITHEYEIVVVDDGSLDGTADLVKQVAKCNASVRLVEHGINEGYGAALRNGFSAAKMDLVVFTDADCQFDLTELDRFVLLANRYDVVCGYRIDRKDTPLRCLYSRVYNQLVRVLLRTGVRDVDCALKMFRSQVLKDMKITGNGFLVNSEILTQANQQGLRVVEVGVSHRPRTDGTSTVSVRHIPKVLTSLLRYWWNTVQFPGTPDSTPPQRTERDLLKSGWATLSDTRAVWLQRFLLVVAALFLLTNLGYPLIGRDESRYAEIPREMLATGNWVLPQLNFQTYYDKPPLLYWLCAISFKLMGVTESAARLVPALAALATTASTMWFGSRFFNHRIGLIAGAVLLLSAGFAFTSRYLLLDGVLALWVTLSLFTAFESLRSGKLKMTWWIASAIFCGLAFLTKGPVALVLWMPPVFAFAWLTHTSAQPRWWHYAITTSVVAAVVAPWMIAVSAQDPDFLFQFLYKHNLRRFAGDFHDRPIWYLLPVLLIGAHPWSFLTIPYAGFLFGQDQVIRCKRPPIVGFLILCSVWCFAFFSLSKCKLPTYLLPAAPSMALMMGHYLDQVFSEPIGQTRHWFARFWSARSATVATCLAAIAFICFVVATDNEVSFAIYLWAMLWTGLLVSAIALVNDRHQANLAWASSSGASFLFAFMMMHQLVPGYSLAQSMVGRSSALQHATQSDSPPAIATVVHEFSEVPFYLGRSDIRNFRDVNDKSLIDFVSNQDRVLLIVSDRAAADHLRMNLPAGTKTRAFGGTSDLANGTQLAKSIGQSKIRWPRDDVQILEVVRHTPPSRVAVHASAAVKR